MIRPGMLRTVVRVHVPQRHEFDYWQSVTNVPCPRCTTGTVRWAEAGYVPGYRICDVCGQAWFAEGDLQHPCLAPAMEVQPNCYSPAPEGERVPVYLHRFGQYARPHRGRRNKWAGSPS